MKLRVWTIYYVFAFLIRQVTLNKLINYKILHTFIKFQKKTELNFFSEHCFKIWKTHNDMIGIRKKYKTKQIYKRVLMKV